MNNFIIKDREKLINNIKSNLKYIINSRKKKINKEFFVNAANNIIEKVDNLTIKQLNGLNLVIFTVSDLLM